jgi:FKBP-type peptidyl-prolyl cis-trans isomerase
MKFTISTAILLLLLGTTASTHAQQEKGQEEHKQDAKPAQAQAKPAQQERQEKPAVREQAQGAKPAQQQPTQQVAHAQPQHTQQAVPAQQPQTHAVNHTQQSNTGQNEGRVQQTHSAAGNRVSPEHGRISDVHYASSFGSGHSFHINRGEYDSRHFAYGGYSFGFVDAWPIDWGYSDDVYVIYADGGYYMYDRVHPGVRISINIL